MTFKIDPNLIENNEVRLTEDGSGNLAIEHVPSGNTVTVDQDVAISDIVTDKLPSNLDAQGNDISNVGSLSTDDLGIGSSNFVESGDPLIIGPNFEVVSDQRSYSTTSTTYENTPTEHFRGFTQWDLEIPANADGYAVFYCNVNPGTDETVDVQLFNETDDEVMLEQTGISSFANLSLSGPYTPTTTSGRIEIRTRIRTSNGANSSEILNEQASLGIQL